MRIYILGTAHPFRGGLAAFNERLAKAFQDLGHEVQIITFTLQYPKFLFPGKTQLSDAPKPQNLEIRPMLNSINPLNWRSVGKKLAAEKPDLLICPYWLSFMAPALGTVLGYVLKNKHTKIIGLIHNLLPHERKIGDKILAKYYLGKVHKAVVLSKSVGEQVQSLTKIPVAFEPHPLYDSYGEIQNKEMARKILNLPQNKPIVLFFGFIRHYKGLDILLDAIANPILADIDIQLLVAGEFYEPIEKYQEKIQLLQAQNRLYLHSDFIPDDKVALYFSAADLVVQPYRNATQSGISQLAYHFEIPMIVSNVGGLAEIVEHGKSGYVLAAQPEAITAAIHDFFVQNKADELKKGLREIKKRFSWENMAKACLPETL